MPFVSTEYSSIAVGDDLEPSGITTIIHDEALARVALLTRKAIDKSPSQGYTCFRYIVGVVVMTRTSLLADAVRIEASADERASATLLVDAIGAPTTQVFSLLLDDGTAVPLSPGLINLLRTSVGELAGGHAVTVLPSETELTPAETAELLGLSRPFVVRLLDGGEIPSHHLPNSRHRRIKLSDVLAFQAQRDRRRAGRQRLNDIVEAAGLPY